MIVIKELEGLSRGAKPVEVNGIPTIPQSLLGNKAANDHSAMVVAMSKNALEFIINSKNQTIK